MAADNEERLLSKAIRNRDLTPLIEAGVKDDWFFNEDNRQMWKFLIKHKEKYGEVPSAVTVKDNFPTYTLHAVDDTVEYLLDQLIEYRKRQMTIDVILDAQQAIQQGDHDQAIQAMGKAVQAIYEEDFRESSDVDLTHEPMQRFQEYLDIKTRPNGLLGVATGFKTVDQATAGLQPGQLVTIIAPPKTGKSVLALQIAVNVHNDGFVPLFQSFEMSNEEQKHRHDAMRAHIAHSRLVRGGLTKPEEERYKDTLESMASMHNFYLTDSVSAMTVTGIAAKIERLNPSILFIDGVYLMIDEMTGEQGTPLALTNITRSLKRLAQKKQIPVVISTQVLLWKMKKRQVSADAIGYSSSFYQDSDVILGLQQQDEEDDSSRQLSIVASRNCGPATADLLWDWEEGKFEEYAAFTGIQSI